MRGFYHVQDGGDTGRLATAGLHYRRAIQVVTLIFWGPCCAVDLWLLVSRGVASEAGFVFGLLFREAIVFLALWFTAALAQGVLLGNRLPRGPDARHRRRLRAYLQAGIDGYIGPTRGNRGQ